MHPLGPPTRESATAKFMDTHNPMHVLKKNKERERKDKDILSQYLLCSYFQHHCARNLKIHFWGGMLGVCVWGGGGGGDGGMLT